MLYNKNIQQLMSKPIEIVNVPNIIVVDCGYTYRISEGGEYVDELKRIFDDAYDDEYEILDTYEDFDMDSCFVVRFKDSNKIPLYKAFGLITNMSDVDFCAFLYPNNITKMSITDEYCYFDIDTESG